MSAPSTAASGDGALAARLVARLASRRARLRLDPAPVDGRLDTLVGLTLRADGCRAPVGSRCLIGEAAERTVEAEVTGFDGGRTLLMPIGAIDGLQPGVRVRPLGRGALVPRGPGLLGRVLDGDGHPVDGRGPLERCERVASVAAPIDPLARAPVREPFDVGVRSINALLTLGRGQRVGLFAGSGVGKSSLLGMMTRHSSADVTVVALIGERGREVGEFVNETLGPAGLERAVVVAVPADRPPLARLHGALLASAIAEGFRESGHEVLLLLDSLTRVAQAQREIGLASGEPPTVRGYPPSVFTLLPRLIERAGALHGAGSITAVHTVLVEGDERTDPVADAARAVLDGHIVLDRALADAAHFPAIDIGASVSRTRDAVTVAADRERVRRCLSLAATYRANEDMLRVGLYERGGDPRLDEAVRLWPHLQRFLRQTPDRRVPLELARRELAALLERHGDTPADAPDEPGRHAG